MAGFGTPGSKCVTTGPASDPGTLNLARSPAPGIIGIGVNSHMPHKKSGRQHSQHGLVLTARHGKHAVNTLRKNVGKLHKKLKLTGEIKIKWPGLDLRQTAPETKSGDEPKASTKMPGSAIGQVAPETKSSDEEKSLKFAEVLEILANAYEGIPEELVAVVRHIYIEHSSYGMVALHELRGRAERALLKAWDAARRLEIIDESGLAPLVRGVHNVGHGEAFRNLLAQGKKADILAAKVEKFGIANHKSLVKFLSTYGPIIEMLEKLNWWVDVLNCVNDVGKIVAAAKHNKTHEMVYRGGDLMFDLTIVALPPIVYLKLATQPYLDWVQTQIEKGPASHAIVEKHRVKNAPTGFVDGHLTFGNNE